jgi:hypothetical protein
MVFGSNFIDFLSFLGFEKSGRFVIFSVDFWLYGTGFGAIAIYRKTGPTKSTVLGPGPPPWEFIEIYWFLTDFHDFGAFNRAGKSVSKIGIYALPPLKSDIYGVFNISRPNFNDGHILSLPRHWYCVLIFVCVPL